MRGLENTTGTAKVLQELSHFLPLAYSWSLSSSKVLVHYVFGRNWQYRKSVGKWAYCIRDMYSYAQRSDFRAPLTQWGELCASVCVCERVYVIPAIIVVLCSGSGRNPGRGVCFGGTCDSAISGWMDGWMRVLSWLSGGGGMRNREFQLKLCGALGWCT